MRAEARDNMTRVFCVLLALICLLLTLASCGGSNAPTHAGHDVDETLEFNKRTRSYILHLPPSMPSSTAGAPLPLVLAFHGGGDTAADMEDLTHFDELADKERFLVVYPQAIANYWITAPDATRTDDVAFVRALLDDLQHRIVYDSTRVYATGVSVGGFFVARLGCEAADRIAAIGIVAATLAAPEAEQCAPARHVSVITMHGTDDTVIPAAGGVTIEGDGGLILSVTDAARAWSRVNNCAAQPEVAYEPDSADDGTRVRRETYSGCADGAAVVFYVVEGGGHNWPGGPSYTNGSVLNRSTQDIDATTVLWRFFQAHTL